MSIGKTQRLGNLRVGWLRILHASRAWDCLWRQGHLRSAELDPQFPCNEIKLSVHQPRVVEVEVPKGGWRHCLRVPWPLFHSQPSRDAFGSPEISDCPLVEGHSTACFTWVLDPVRKLIKFSVWDTLFYIRPYPLFYLLDVRLDLRRNVTLEILGRLGSPRLFFGSSAGLRAPLGI